VFSLLRGILGIGSFSLSHFGACKGEARKRSQKYLNNNKAMSGSRCTDLYAS